MAKVREFNTQHKRYVKLIRIYYKESFPTSRSIVLAGYVIARLSDQQGLV